MPSWSCTRFLAGFALSTTLLVSTGSVRAQTAPGSEDPNNWPQFHRTSNGWRYSPLDQINKENVSHLHVAWIHQAGDFTMGRQDTPIVIDGVVYTIASYNRVFALDGKTGQEIWHYQPKLDELTKKIIFAPFSRGVAVGRGKVFVGTVDGRGIALDQKTGKLVWTVQLTDFKECQGCNFTSPPVLAGDMLTYGPTGGELSAQGKIYGVKADTGEKVWEFNTIKEDPESWPDEQAAKYGGGGAWMPGIYDSETNTVFYGTGNPGADFFGENRKGDNLYTDSMLALDPTNGKLKWFRQETEHDVWDYDSTNEPLLIDRGGKSLIVHLSKNGFVSVMDKHNGKLENVWPLVETYDFVKKIDPTTGMLIGRNEPTPGKPFTYCPSWAGGRSWTAGAYNPKTGLWYTDVLELCTTVTAVQQKGDPKQYAVGHMGAEALPQFKMIDGKAPGRLDARDPITGERKWTYEMKVPLIGSVLATGGDLVFNGDPFGVVRAFDANNGKVLWSFNTGSGSRGGIVSYAVGGTQYILVPSGWGSFGSMFLPQAFPELANIPGGSMLIAFRLD